MIARSFIVLLALTTLAACTDNTRPAQNAQTKGDSAVQQMAEAHNANVKDPDQKVVCHRVAPIGSRITHLECKTVWQEKAQEKDAQKYLDMPKPYTTKGN